MVYLSRRRIFQTIRGIIGTCRLGGLQKECHVVPRQFVQFESEQSCLGKRSKSMPTKVSAVSPLQTYVFPMQKRDRFLCVNFTILDSFLPQRPESSFGIYTCKVKWVLAEHHPDLSIQIPFRCLGWTKRRNEWACRIAAVCQVWAPEMSQCPKARLWYRWGFSYAHFEGREGWNLAGKSITNELNGGSTKLKDSRRSVSSKIWTGRQAAEIMPGLSVTTVTKL